MRRKKYLWRLSAGLAALLFGPLSLFAQEAGEEQPSPTWEKFIEGLKKLIPGNLEDDFLDTIKEDSGILIEILIAIPVVFLVTYLLTRVLKWLVFKAAARSTQYQVQWLRAYPVLRLLAWVLAIVYLLQLLMGEHWEILVFGLLIMLAYAGKDGIKDLLGGLWLTIERPFSVGDRITVDGYYGEVADIGLRATTINTLDDSKVAVPNSFILGNSISNSTSGKNYCMVVTELWLPITVDVQRAKRIAYEAAISSPYLNLDKSVTVLALDYFREELATVIQVKAYVLARQYEKLFQSDVTEAAKQAFREEGLYS